MRVLIYTFGTRGDVQPYVALGQALQRAGHQVVISTAEGFRDLIAPYGMIFRPAGSRMLEVVRDALPDMAGARGLLGIYGELKRATREAMDEHWAVAQDVRPDLIIYHPKCEAAPSIAERLGAEVMMALPLPFYTPTRDFPIPYTTRWEFGGRTNLFSYRLPRWFGLLYGRLLNDFRRSVGLRAMNWFADPLRAPNGSPMNVLYGFSRHVVPVPADYPPTAHVTGYWFSEGAADWQPDPRLVDFLESGPPPVYVGFGSMGFGQGSEERTAAVRTALQANRVRGVIATGWGGLAGESTDDILVTDAAPHDWLFPRMRAVVHHGGAGTTGAGLAAGCPTLVVPFLADQGFWGLRVQRIGAGPAPLHRRRLTADTLTGRIAELINNDSYTAVAKDLAIKIRSEDGGRAAVRVIEDLDLDLRSIELDRRSG